MSDAQVEAAMKFHQQVRIMAGYFEIQGRWGLDLFSYSLVRCAPAAELDICLLWCVAQLVARDALVGEWTEKGYLGDYLNKKGLNGAMVEIGVQRGLFADWILGKVSKWKVCEGKRTCFAKSYRKFCHVPGTGVLHGRPVGVST